MRNQAHTLMSLVMVAGVAAAGFIGACGGKVVVDASNPSGNGGAGGSLSMTSGPQVATGQVSVGSVMTSGQVDVAVSVGPSQVSAVSVGPGQVSAVSVGPGQVSAVSVGPGPSSVSSGPDTSVAVSVGPGPSASSSTGGPTNACEAACDKSTACGLDFCGQFNINCNNPLPGQVQCPLTCIGNASCGDIQKLAMQNFATPLGACIFGCQGMGVGGVGSSGVGPGSSSATGIPPVMACQQCTVQQCGGPIAACAAKQGPGSCSHWLQCAQSCGTDSMCLFGCDSQYPNAKPQYNAIYQCLCNKCDSSCPGENACQHTGP